MIKVLQFIIIFILTFSLAYANCDFRNKDYGLGDKKIKLITIGEKLINKYGRGKLKDSIGEINSGSTTILFFKDYFNCDKLGIVGNNGTCHDISNAFTSLWNYPYDKGQWYYNTVYLNAEKTKFKVNAGYDDAKSKGKTEFQIRGKYIDFLKKLGVKTVKGRNFVNLKLSGVLTYNNKIIIKDKNGGLYTPNGLKNVKVYIPKGVKKFKLHLTPKPTTFPSNRYITYISDDYEGDRIIDYTNNYSSLNIEGVKTLIDITGHADGSGLPVGFRDININSGGWLYISIGNSSPIYGAGSNYLSRAMNHSFLLILEVDKNTYLKGLDEMKVNSRGEPCDKAIDFKDFPHSGNPVDLTCTTYTTSKGESLGDCPTAPLRPGEICEGGKWYREITTPHTVVCGSYPTGK